MKHAATTDDGELDSTYDPTGGYLPESSLTTTDTLPDPEQTPQDLGVDDSEESNPQAVRIVEMNTDE